MDLLWMILPVFLVCAEAQNPTEVRGGLGQDVTLNCSVTSNVYWYMEIHSQFRAPIARSFSTDPNDTKYCFYTTVTTKYKAAGNTLVITNVTSEDFRLYFCSKSQNNTFKDAFRLVPGAPITPSTNDKEANNHQQQELQQQHPSELVVYSSFALNALLILVIIGLVFTFPCLKRKNCSFRVNDPSPLTCENPETLETSQYSCCVYEEIQLPTYQTQPQAASRPELLRSTLPRLRHLGHLDGY